jgi:hypothetical protein
VAGVEAGLQVLLWVAPRQLPSVVRIMMLKNASLIKNCLAIVAPKVRHAKMLVGMNIIDEELMESGVEFLKVF